MSGSWPVESKVKAGAGGAAGGAGAGAIVAAFVLWALTRWAFHGDVPGPVVALVLLVVPAAVSAGGSYLAGYLAPHTPRPDLTAVARRLRDFPPPSYSD